jgi:hypothetical protein
MDGANQGGIAERLARDASGAGEDGLDQRALLPYVIEELALRYEIGATLNQVDYEVEDAGLDGDDIGVSPQFKAELIDPDLADLVHLASSLR